LTITLYPDPSIEEFYQGGNPQPIQALIQFRKSGADPNLLNTAKRHGVENASDGGKGNAAGLISLS
jgi:hypothetical protein